MYGVLYCTVLYCTVLHLKVPGWCCWDIMTTDWRLGTSWLVRPPGLLVARPGMISTISL